MNQLSQKTKIVVKGKLVITDVDGVLTDGKVLYNDDGSRGRMFSVIDGHGFEMLKKHGFDVVLMSGENDDNIARRAEKLDCVFLHSDGFDKKQVLDTFILFNYPTNTETYVIGDDVGDIEIMRGATMAMTPKGSKLSEILGNEIQELGKKGGDGVFREFAETILLSNGIDPYEGL